MDQIFESHFGGSSNNSNGGETDGYCPKCRADTSHIILESYGDEVRPRTVRRLRRHSRIQKTARKRRGTQSQCQ